MSERLYQIAKSAIHEVANDDSIISLMEILENLRGLRDEIEILIEAVKTDIERDLDG